MIVKKQTVNFCRRGYIPPGLNLALAFIAVLFLWKPPSGMTVQAPNRGTSPIPASGEASLLAHGESAYHSGRLDLARHYLEEAIRLAPQSARAHALLGLTMARQKDFKEALANLRQAHEYDPANGDYAFDYAVLLLQDGRFAAAIPVLEDLHRKSPQSGDVLVNLARADAGAAQFQKLSALVSALPAVDYHDAALLKTLATVLAGTKQTSTLEKLWRSAIKNDPTGPLAYAALAGIWTTQDKAIKALALLDGAPAAARGPVYLYARGKTLLALGRYDEASQSFRGITVQIPQNEQAWHEMIWAEVLANHLRKADAEAGEAAKKFSQVTEFRYQQAVVNYMLGRTTIAIDALTRILQKGGVKDPRPVLLMAVLESQTGNYESAVSYFARLPQLESGCDALASYFYGSTLLRMHRPDAAAIQLQAAIRCRLRFALAEYRLGQALTDSGKLREALTVLEQATQDDPSLAEPYYALAQLRRRLGDNAGAEAAIARFNSVHQHVKNSDQELLRNGLQ
ncbi:MAG TPA: tetratricopeptide repeat protein [Terriglobia bacterium]|nr:tetratricopeptide repeat protein [Terriglobia bacterium]